MQSLLDIKTELEDLVEPEPEPRGLRSGAAERAVSAARAMVRRPAGLGSLGGVGECRRPPRAHPGPGAEGLSGGLRAFRDVPGIVRAGYRALRAGKSQAFQDIDQAVDVANTRPSGRSRPISPPRPRRAGRRASAMAGIDADKKTGAAIELAKLDVQRADGVGPADGVDLRPDRLDQGERGRARRQRRGGGRPDRRRDPPAAGEGAAPWSSGPSTPRAASRPSASGWPSTSTRSTPTSPSATRRASPPTAACSPPSSPSARTARR